jgi:hypothetical protein
MLTTVPHRLLEDAPNAGSERRRRAKASPVRWSVKFDAALIFAI